jgi:hypothetical protein
LDRRGRFHSQPLSFVFFLARLAFAAELRQGRGNRKTAVRHSHHPLSDAVRFSFQRVVNRADLEFRLYRREITRVTYVPVKNRKLAEIPIRAASQAYWC